jgi:CrcB protein
LGVAGKWIAVGLLGGLGSIARFELDAVIAERLGGRWPWGTLAVNASGALLLGLLVGMAVTGDALLLAGGAALGSYTTFSTWVLETERLGEDGLALGAWLNICASLAIGLGAVALGRAIGNAL